MLFKYLIGTIALAASVMSSPTAEYQSGSVRTENYNKCISTITEVQAPLKTACQAEKVEDVNVHLKKVYKPVKEISTRFEASTKIEETAVVEHSKKFIKVLEHFESVLLVIQPHPKISNGCKDVFIEFDYSFENICTEFQKHGVDIHKTIRESSLQISVWEGFGFKFNLN